MWAEPCLVYMVFSMYACITIHTDLLVALKAAYEEAHRSDGDIGLQNLDYCMKKQTDDITNIVNG